MNSNRPPIILGVLLLLIFGVYARMETYCDIGLLPKFILVVMGVLIGALGVMVLQRVKSKG